MDSQMPHFCERKYFTIVNYGISSLLVALSFVLACSQVRAAPPDANEIAESGGVFERGFQFNCLVSQESSSGVSQFFEEYIVMDGNIRSLFQLRATGEEIPISKGLDWLKSADAKVVSFKNLLLLNRDYFARCVLGDDKAIQFVGSTNAMPGMIPCSPFWGGVEGFLEFKSLLLSEKLINIDTKQSENGTLISGELTSDPERPAGQNIRLSWVFNGDDKCVRITKSDPLDAKQDFVIENEFVNEGNGFIPRKSIKKYSGGYVQTILIGEYTLLSTVEESIFRLSHYGFPEPKASSSKNFPWFSVALLGLGATLLLIVYGLKKRKA
jgi:hypothetical protein